jgi:hypothetical protein
MNTPSIAFLVLVICGFAAFMIAVAWGMYCSRTPSTPRTRVRASGQTGAKDDAEDELRAA